jgi:hypothetical protein
MAVAVMAALALAAPGGAVRAEAPVVFDLTIRGIEAATLSFTGTVEDGRYSVAGVLQSAGLVGVLRRIRYEGQSRGSVRGGRFTPAIYVENAETGRRSSVGEMRYRRGVPQVKAYDPPRPEGEAGLDPAAQGGTVDPLTAMFAVLRDVPQGQECNLALTLFDGERRSEVRVGAPAPGPEGVLTCPGEYRRLAGFSAEDMAERTRFPFALVVTPVAGGLARVTEVRMDTLFGRAVMTRRAAE